MPQQPLRLRKAQIAKGGVPGTSDDTRRATKKTSQDPKPALFFPWARYTSITGVQICLLCFTALYLPRSSLSFLLSFNSFSSPASGDSAPSDTLFLLTSNPARTVAWLCAGMLLLQAWYASWIRSWSRDASLVLKGVDAAEVTKYKLERSEANKERVEALGHASLTTLAAALTFYVLIVLFGAPIASHVLHTCGLAMLLALLTVWTPAYTLGMPALGPEALVIRLTWIRLFAEFKPRTPIERAMAYPAIGAALGCWSAVVPIGLDWERPWQAWPLTPAYGAVSGYMVGSSAAWVISTVLWLAEADLNRPPQRKQRAQNRQR